MAKSALTTGALTLGTASIGAGVAGAQDESSEAAFFADNYYPGANFDVVAQLEASTTVNTLQIDGETVDEISQPDEWNGYIIRYDIGAQSGITTFMFVRSATLSEGDSGTAGEDASVLSSELNLLTTSLNGGGGGDDNGDTNGDEEITDDEDNGDLNESNGDLNESNGNLNESEGDQ
ncbi:calcium-binding protein [Halosolutus gelatinilyticus]|uniref:calcium-binding protein n=1 Tax=Halosolutus gelatinilyticus TaxID=2931975 RepID=UPI001FF69E94|nr:calcium-binding protein [Halosolutus gelatinilyticus]